MMKPRAKQRCGRWAAVLAAAALLSAPAAQARQDPSTGARVPEQPTVVVEPGDGFDWADAGIGAGVAAGLVLFGAGTAKIVRRHRHVPAMRPRHL
jgi:hypothetical protein